MKIKTKTIIHVITIFMGLLAGTLFMCSCNNTEAINADAAGTTENASSVAEETYLDDEEMSSDSDDIFSCNPETLDEEQRAFEINLLKEDFEKNRKLYDNLISAILEDHPEKENFGAYYDVEEQCLMTYDYSNKPEKLKSPALNKTYKEYYEKSEIPFEGIHVSYDYSFSISFEGRSDKNNLYNPLILYYYEYGILNQATDNVKLNDNWFAEFAKIF